MPSQTCANKSHICDEQRSTDVADNSLHVELRVASVGTGKSEFPVGNSDPSDEIIATTKRVETAPTVPTLNDSPALQGGTNTNPKQELMMQSDTTTAHDRARTLALIDASDLIGEAIEINEAAYMACEGLSVDARCALQRVLGIAADVMKAARNKIDAERAEGGAQ